MTPAPIILLGPPGGDIARVAGALGRQPGVLSLPELRCFGADSIQAVQALHERAEDRSGDGLLRVVAQLRFGSQDEDTIHAAHGWLDRRAEWSIDALLDWLLRHARAHCVLHEPHAALRIDACERLLKALPEALFVQVVEPVSDFCARTHHDMHGRLFAPPEAFHHIGRYPRLAPSLMWFRVHDTLLRLRNDYPALRWRTLRADLVRDQTARALDPILLEVGQSYDVGGHSRQPFAATGPRNAPLGDDPAFLQDPYAWPRYPQAPTDPGMEHPDLAALSRRIGAPLPTGVSQ